MRFLALGLSMILAASSAMAQSAPTTITVNLGKKLGPYKPIYAWFG